MLTRPDPREAQAFLAANPDVETVDLLIADLNGILRGKRIDAGELAHAYRDGIFLSRSLFASDITGNTIETSGLGFAQGDRDDLCLPVPGTLCRIPWRERPSAQLQLAMFLGEEQPYAGDPQAVLQRVLQRFETSGLQPVVAVEMEFYLIDTAADARGHPQAAVSPVTGLRPSQTQVYGIADIEDQDRLIGDIASAAAVQGLPADTAVAEASPSQFEINLHYQPDAQAACRHGLLLKRLIKALAARHAAYATFMPRPFQQLVGSGMHLHVSVLDDQDRNVFADGELPNEMLRHAIGGLAATMPEAMLLFAPNANSYRRFVADSYAPLAPSWGINNRTVALRIPPAPRAATRVEHRVAGADANPYLLCAAVLAGMHHGMEQRIEPPPPTTGNGYDQHPRSLPDSWREAIAAWRAGPIIPRYLGEELARVLLAVKEAELAAFETVITPLEYEWYLRTS